MSKSKGEVPNPYIWSRHSFTGKRLPRSRVLRSFLLMVPWINLMVLAVLVYCVFRQTIVQPGWVVELPTGTPEGGAFANHPTAIVRRLIAPGRADASVLLLDEGRYSSDRPRELEALKQLEAGETLNLIIDSRVSYGEALKWVERLKACGAVRVNLVTTSLPQGEAEIGRP